jgi:mono/diheme cytochrome c family protein
MKDLLIVLSLLTGPVAVFVIFGNPGPDFLAKGAGAPSYSVAAEPGLVALAEECAACHGRLAEGTGRGPNLIHPDYGPARRSDDQFRRAVREGMPARRGYGAMPAMPSLPDRSLDRTITFLRELQRAKGIR